MADARAGSAHTNARVRVPPSARGRSVCPSVRGAAGVSDPRRFPPGQQSLPPVPSPLPATPGPAHSSG